MTVEPGDPVVVVDGELDRYHLPVEPNFSNKTFAAMIAEDGLAPPSWATLCGSRGRVWMMAPILADRVQCPRCARAEQRAA